MSRVKRTFRLLWLAVKIIFTVFVFSVIGFLVWRAFFSVALPDEMEPLMPNAALVAAYEADPSLSDAFIQGQRSITSTERNYGYFSTERTTFIPSANQIQVLFRYNNSTLRATQEDYGLAEPPAREDDNYDFSIVIVRDLTPENKDDNLTGEGGSTEEIRLFPTAVSSAEKGLYNYRLCVFELGELSLSELVESETLIAVFADIYYAEDIDYQREAYGTLCLYDYITSTEKFSLTDADIAALEAARSKE